MATEPGLEGPILVARPLIVRPGEAQSEGPSIGSNGTRASKDMAGWPPALTFRIAGMQSTIPCQKGNALVV